MKANRSVLSALAVVDLKGHILNRIGQDWIHYSRGSRHQILFSHNTSNYRISRLSEKYDIVHWVDQLRFVPCADAIKAPQIVMIHHLTSDMEEEILPRLKFCDGVTTVSRYWQSKLETMTGDSVGFIPNAIDTRIFIPSPARSDKRRAVGIGDNDFVLGFVAKAKANHVGRKGVDLLLEVLQAASHRWPNLKLILVGPGWDKLGQSVEKMGIEVKRFQYASADETVEAYWLMDALLVTASEEGGPCTVLEAMAAGVPVISSVVGLVPEVIIDGQTGFLCKKRQPEEYLAALERLWGDQDLSIRITSIARDVMIRERDPRIVIPRIDFESIYTKAINHYQARTTTDRLSRRIRQGKWWLRHIGREVLLKTRRSDRTN